MFLNGIKMFVPTQHLRWILARNLVTNNNVPTGFDCCTSPAKSTEIIMMSLCDETVVELDGK